MIEGNIYRGESREEKHDCECCRELERKLMAVSATFQAQLDRLTAYVGTLSAAPAATDAEDTAALSSALDTAGAPAAVASASPAPSAPAAS